jgi:hypothetical protein
MSDVAGLLGQLRGETPPAAPYHPAVARRKFREDLRALQKTGGETDLSPDAPPRADAP